MSRPKFKYCLCYKARRKNAKRHLEGYFIGIESIMKNSLTHNKHYILEVYRAGDWSNVLARMTSPGNWEFYTNEFNTERRSGKYDQ